MNGVANFVRGSAAVEMEQGSPEALLNLCAQEGIPFWDLCRTEERSRFFIPLRDADRMAALGKAAACTVRIAGRRGLPVFLHSLRRRWALVPGLLLCLVAQAVLAQFIWTVEVTGNETVPDREILAVLEDLGMQPGTFALSIDSQDLRSRALTALPELSWLAVNVTGSRATVVVRERTPKPDIVDRRQPARVVAEKSGVIERLYVWEGAAMVAKGDTVAPGDLLVTGDLTSLSSGDRQVHASADIWARTWYEYTDTVPLMGAEKQYTGKRDTKSALIFAGKRLNLYLDTGFSRGECDKITKQEQIVLFDKLYLPLELVRETALYYEAVETRADPRAAAEALQARMLEQLAAQVRGQVVWNKFEVTESDGAVTVTLRAECLERIDQTELLPTA